jgi:polysaccharide biosynthesis/export protein
VQLLNLNGISARLAVRVLGCWLAAGGSLAAKLPQEPTRTGTDGRSAATDSASAGKKTKPGKRSTSGAQSDSTDPRPAPEGYRIGVDDSLFISVWKEPDLSSQVTVRPDGVITLPLVNDIPVVGLSPKELQALLTEKLKPFVNEPQVTVIVRDIKSRKVYLVGQVGKQGSIPLSGNMTLMELLASAGGLGPFAKSESIYVIRNQDGHQVRLPFHYKKVLEGKATDIVLLPGDMIVVP